MLLRTVLVLGTVVLAAALPREHRQIGFFAPPPWAVPSDYSDQSSEEVGFPSPPHSSLGSMLKSMQEMMVNMRRQFTEGLSRLPQVPSFPTIGFKPSDSAPTNTTSITKVVNGHEVTVNETTYESQDGGHVFRIKTVDIKPHEELPKTTSPDDSLEKDVSSEEKVSDLEPAGNPQESPKTNEDEVQTTTTLPAEENEIPQSVEEMINSGEDWQPDVISSQSGSRWPMLPRRLASNWHVKTHYPRGHSPDVEMVPGMRPIDLSGDLRVNQILSDKADAGALIMPDPDSEFVELKDGKIVPEIQAV